MDGVIRISVLGQPHPKGSKRGFVRGKRAVLVEQTGEGLATWRPRLQAAIAEAQPADGPVPDPVAVFVCFRLQPPKKRRWPWPVAMNKGDIDKLARTVLDELASVVIADDSQVVLLACSKVYDDRPGAQITVMPLLELIDPEFGQAAETNVALELGAHLRVLVVHGRNEEEVRV